MWFYFEPGSSPVDWCEENYQVSDNIAEFANTVSFKSSAQVLSPSFSITLKS